MSDAASRDGYGRALLRMAADPRTVVLDADLGKSTRSSWFREQHPDRSVSLGIGEQNMMLVAAGLAASGYRPFASTFAIFTERAFEQVRNGISRTKLPVHICGSHGGIHTGTDGSSAQSIEDLAVFRSLPNMQVVHPADDVAAEVLTLALAQTDAPSYLRTLRNSTPRLYDEVSGAELSIGRGSVLRSGADVAFVACGVMVHRCLQVAELLAAQGVEATVVDMHTIKPLDEALIERLSREVGAFVTAEDHNVIGGLGGAVAESLGARRPAPLERIGVPDRYGESGEGDELLAHLGLGLADLMAAAERAMARRDE